MAQEYYEYQRNKLLRRSMDRLRRSFRDSFRRGSSKDRGGGPAAATSADGKPQQWQQDEATVRAGTCNFFVKYLGCVEVFESRGMQVCEEALKVLRAQKRRPIKAVLYVSGDGLRVVDAENKGLLVDQTIEKVSFCAPDRAHEKGFAYICRDGTTRRWMCHGFHAARETGERLSHAVGCAFAVCLEKKQRRDRDAATTSAVAAVVASHALVSSASVDSTPVRSNGGEGVTNGTFARAGSFRQASLTERLADPQNVKPAQPPPMREAAPLPSAVARPVANPELFQRAGSLRMPAQAGPAFRRHQSLRMGDLPSTLLRQAPLGVPGARVSAIPEEENWATPHERSLPASLAALGSHNRPPLIHADTVTGMPVGWEGPGHSRGHSAASSADSARSKADEWLESTLASSSNGGPSSPPSTSPPPADVFGQPAFAPPALPPRPPKVSVKAQSLDVDPFEAKWSQMSPAKAPPTNPFRAASDGVDI